MNITDNQNKINVTVSVQEKDGKFYAVLQYKDENGKKQYKWKATKIKAEKGNKREANRKAEEIRQQFEIELNAPKLLAPTTNGTDILFADYLLEWLETKKGNIEITTYSGYERNVKRISNYFRELGIKLNELKTSHLKAYYNKLQQTKYRGKPLKYKTIRRYHANIHKALEDAIQLELIDINPASKIEHNKDEQYIASHYNKEELDKLFEIIKGNLIELHILIAAYYGFRREEVVGLKWDAINFIDNTITVEFVVSQASVNGKYQLIEKKRPKNKTSCRTLPLIPYIRELLLAEKERQEKNKKIFGNTYKNKGNYILVREDGDLIKPSCVTERFGHIINDNNLKHIYFRDLRHSCASLLLANGVNMKQIQEWLGHSTFNTTANIYSHLETDTKEISANVIAEVLSKSA